MKQEDVAKALGVRAITISRWERGVSPPSLADIVRLAGLLRVSVERLATGEAGAPPVAA